MGRGTFVYRNGERGVIFSHNSYLHTDLNGGRIV